MMCAWAAPTSRHGAGGLTGSFGQKGLFFSISVGNRKKNCGNLTSSLVSLNEQLFTTVFNILKFVGLAGWGGRENTLLQCPGA